MGGWYPGNEAIMDGFRLRALSPSSSAKVVHSSRYPKSRVEMVDVGGGKRIPKGELDSYLRRFEVESTAWRRPIPEEYLAREDIAEAYKFGCPGGVSIPVTRPRRGLVSGELADPGGSAMRRLPSFQVARGGGSRYRRAVEMVDAAGATDPEGRVGLVPAAVRGRIPGMEETYPGRVPGR
jgi:hypothetical protein